MSAPISLSLTQRDVYKKLSELACLYFTGDFSDLATQPRLFPLIAGPTGAGKSFLVRTLAKEIDAHFMRICYGDWIPLGSRMGDPTMKRITDALTNHDYVILHIDELDKFRMMFESTWGTAIASDLWNILDLQIDINPNPVIRPATVSRDKIIRRLDMGVKNRLWIVGSGTWQEIFDGTANRPVKSTVGFAPMIESTPCLSSIDEKQRLIREQDIIPKELFARFHNEILIIDYPKTLEETTDMLEHTGITRLANKLNVTIDPRSISFAEQGLRVLESISSDLLMKKQHQKLKKAGIPETEPFPAIPFLNQRIKQFDEPYKQPEPLDPDVEI